MSCGRWVSIPTSKLVVMKADVPQTNLSGKATRADLYYVVRRVDKGQA
jgi:hypothetical protein